MREVFVGSRSELEEGTRLLIEIDGVEIGVLEHGGELFAYENRCSHQGGPVCEGTLLGKAERILDTEGRDRGGCFSDREIHLICPWHGWEFNLASGQSVAYPELHLQRYELVERDGDVYLAV